MLSAYATALVEQKETIATMGSADELTIILHEGLGGAILLQGTKGVPCPNGTMGCLRCFEKRGGYVFKWYSPLWREDYVAAVKEKQQRTTAPIWVPGADETLQLAIRSGTSMKQVLLWKSLRCDSYGCHIPPNYDEKEFEEWRELCLQIEGTMELHA